jgi:GxxExxY protein
MPKTADGKFKELTAAIIGAAIEVHRHLGPGLLESTYEECLEWELRQRGFKVGRQLRVPVTYKGAALKSSYRLDLLVNDAVIVDVKAIDRPAEVHTAQLLTYLRHTDLEVGLMINFNSALLRDGIKRVVLARREDNEPEGAGAVPS